MYYYRRMSPVRGGCSFFLNALAIVTRYKTMKQFAVPTSVSEMLQSLVRPVKETLLATIDVDLVKAVLSRKDILVAVSMVVLFVILLLRISRLLHLEWSDGSVLRYSDSFAAVFGIQGRRPTMEDRYFYSVISWEDPMKLPAVRISGVLDGHGGEVRDTLPRVA